MDVRSSGEVKVELPKVLSYLDSINKIIAKVDTINSLSLFSTIVNSFPSETLGTEETAQNIIDLLFPRPEDQEDGLAYLFSNTDFVCLKQDVDNLNKIFKDFDSPGPQSFESNHDLDVIYNAVVDDDGNTLYQLVTNSDKEDIDLSKNISLETAHSEFPITFKIDLPDSDQVFEEQDLDANSEEVNETSEISSVVTNLKKDPTESSHDDDNERLRLKELVAWIFEEACKENIPTDFDPLRGQYPSYYGLSSKLGKHECF